MHICEAKQELANTLRAYLRRDETGAYLYPRVRQRPLLLMGPPGIGKTAIVSQIAREEGLPLVAYTMTHHTRQSAVGLPQIKEKTYGGKAYAVTEYTMSEIIGAVYDAMAATGKDQGILFLDEINCVSETLAPTMLQFLQNKTFGTHALPEGWVIVAAGNPPEYNKSVRDFDIVTLDRLRVLNIRPEVETFLDYAARHRLHGAVLSYLGLKPERFYHVSREEAEPCYVTARGWEDLSVLLQSYEALDLPVSQELVAEFLNYEETAKDFYGYYRLYRKYGRDYGVKELLSGEAEDGTRRDRIAMARSGDFGERFTLVGLLLEQLRRLAWTYTRLDRQAVALQVCLKAYLGQGGTLEEFLCQRKRALDTKRAFRLCGPEEQRLEEQAQKQLEEFLTEAKDRRLRDREQLDPFLKEAFQKSLAPRKAQAEALGEAIDRAIAFCLDAFGDGQELLLLLTGMTDSEQLMDYIARFGSKSYLALCHRLEYQRGEAELQKLCQ